RPMLSRDQARFFRSDKWPGLELMQAYWVRHTFAKHFHDAYTIGINDYGAGSFHCHLEEEYPLMKAIRTLCSRITFGFTNERRTAQRRARPGLHSRSLCRRTQHG